MTCARTGNVEAAKVLLDARRVVDAVESWRGQTAADVGGGARGTPTWCAMLIAAGADVNARSTISHMGAAANGGAA